MKRNIFITILLSCFLVTFVACDDEIEDASSKHVYGEDENPYLRTDVDATVTTDMEFSKGHIEAQEISLDDYSETFKEKMDMTVDQIMSGLEDGSIVFYSINSTRGYWDKTATTKGSTGWYYNSASAVVAESEDYIASIDLDKTKKTLSVLMVDDAVAGTIATLNVGFAKNGDDYDDYVRFSFNLSVTDPSVIITSISIPDGDYASYGIDFNQYSSNIQTCMGMTVEEFFSNLDYNGDTGDATGKSIHMYSVSVDSVKWDETSSYTAERPGYWLNDKGVVCGWGDDGFSIYANTKNADQKLYIGRAPSLDAGTEFKICIGYKDTSNEDNYFRLIITATLE